ncbi:type I-E CRISPR-associated protein Cas7/Cse4/CasC [Lentilactobacillus raoultii]|uniref:Type I-E CRISPR-associated protein Cas7/Cse4/CasC n=1 Tax=Lentilactobacillus raoultii TaxID=1987503 RepID=A0ABW3PFX6_9LACO|nr:type I-E CRISPR-associated protein Cas7/Cse4/CasC [Lentilactobacillus raoultii]
MTEQNLYLDLNVLQTVPSSNINRDDTGSPKSALYGGVSRARVSSQSWKRAMRTFFKEASSAVSTGIRTKEAAQLLADKLMTLDSKLDKDGALDKAAQIFKSVGIKIDKKTSETGALLLVSPGQIDKLAQYAFENDEIDKSEVKKALKTDDSLDLALFGRMVADNPELNVEATAQVAHAISTHEVVPEFDYFTALDDLQPKDNAGAAMLGTVEFNSSTLYRYANLNVRELAKDLGSQDAITGVEAFIKAFLLSMPTGKQNTFANKTLPNYVMITLRSDTPVNLVSAFEDPVTSRNGYVKESVHQLEEAFKSTLKLVNQPELTVVLTDAKYQSELDEQVDNLTDLLNKVKEELTEVVQDDNANN